MPKKIAIAVASILVVLAGYIASRPSQFRISRSRTVAAPPNLVYAYVNDFHKWPEWSPWDTLDPAMKNELSGAPAGPGAVYSWWGNNKVGEGRMTITDSRPPRSVTIRLEFIKPWTATNTAQFDFVPSGSGTNVTWAMSGHNHFMAKAFSVFMDMDRMVGPDFDRGLANLDAATEAAMTRSSPAAAPRGERS